MTDATKEINELNSKYLKEMRSFEKKLNDKYLKKIEKIKRTNKRCPIETNEYSKKYNPKTGKISEIRGKKCGCGEFTPKKDWITVSIEDINIKTVRYDSGYGDDDELAYVRQKDYYKVCPNCHKMVWEKYETLGESSTFTRRSDDDDDIERARNFVPDGWKAIVKVEKT